MHNFRKLQIWKDGLEIAKLTYVLIKDLPLTEKFGLIAQMSRSSVSVSTNIAEGSSRSSNKEFSHFLSISLRSLFELETQLILCAELKLIEIASTSNLIFAVAELQKKISAFKKTLLI